MFKEKIISREELKIIIKQLKKQNKKIVTTNGAFDILHAGHVKSFFKAKELGDILIVGLNSDSSIQQYKSKDRPIIPQEDRAIMIAALECVDYVTIFDELTPNNILKIIKPDIHVKSKTAYNKDEEPALKSTGAELFLIDDIPGISTTKIINKILEIYNKEQNQNV